MLYRVMTETTIFGPVYNPRVLPPSMNQVIETATKFLNHDTYQPRDVTSRSKLTRGRKSRRDSAESDEDSSDDNSTIPSSSSSSDEELSSDEDESERKRKSSRKGKKRSDEKETKENEKPSDKVDPPVQSNIEDLAERFRRLELKLGERANRDSQTQNPRPALYCIMCGHSGHGIRDCSESKFFMQVWTVDIHKHLK